jgi:hypothetical protein
MVDSLRKVSQMTNTMTRTIAMTRDETIAALFQKYRVPPSSKANIRRTDDARSKNIPTISIRARVDLSNLRRRRCLGLSFNDASDIGRYTATKMKETIPPGMLKWGQTKPDLQSVALTSRGISISKRTVN